MVLKFDVFTWRSFHYAHALNFWKLMHFIHFFFNIHVFHTLVISSFMFVMNSNRLQLASPSLVPVILNPLKL